MAEGPERWRTPYGLWRKLRPVVRGMRHEPTSAEDRLWWLLRRKGLDGVRFRRQHAVDRFVLDFFAPRFGLAVELDGGIHAERTREDAVRDEHLARLGIAVLRLPNALVLTDPQAALQRIRDALAKRTPNSKP
jgi:very-short-patch-repair endonuclease